MMFAASSSAKLCCTASTPHPATGDTFKFSIRSSPAYVQCAHRTWVNVFLACSSHVTALTSQKASGRPPARKCPHLFRSSCTHSSLLDRRQHCRDEIAYTSRAVPQGTAGME